MKPYKYKTHFISLIVQKDACGRFGIGPACCTDEIMNSYSKLLSTKLQTILNNQLDELIYSLSISKQEIDRK